MRPEDSHPRSSGTSLACPPSIVRARCSAPRSVIPNPRGHPMFAMPDAAHLVELAAALNLRLNLAEAELYLPLIRDAMRELDTFVQSRADESPPPSRFPERAPGYRPSP